MLVTDLLVTDVRLVELLLAVLGGMVIGFAIGVVVMFMLRANKELVTDEDFERTAYEELRGTATLISELMARDRHGLFMRRPGETYSQRGREN